MGDTAGGSRHFVAIVGGACSGAEAAARLADRGVHVAVFEQHPRPYGKIEDGLPRWHDKQRRQEYEKLRDKLDRPNVHFVPLTKIGRDLEFEELVNSWGFSAVLLANGAWRDRPLGVEGADDYVGRGLVYQNPFIYWFNHHQEQGYAGPRFDPVDDAIIVGGGLASIDVAKVFMLESVARALAARGIHVDVVPMEHRGIDLVLKEHGLTLEDLGLKGCTLYYRRRMLDMPVAAYKDGATPEERKKTEDTRVKLTKHAMAKFLFRFQECHLPVAPLVEDGRMVGLRFVRTEIREGKVVSLPGTEVDVRSAMSVSSIGSIPHEIKGVPMKGEFYRYKSWETGEVDGLQGVYGLGNVVTGKGNIAVSRRHGRFVAEHVAASYLGVGSGQLDVKEGLSAPADAETRAQVQAIAESLPHASARTPDQIEAVMKRIRERQRAVGYDGHYQDWITRNTPPDLQ